MTQSANPIFDKIFDRVAIPKKIRDSREGCAEGIMQWKNQITRNERGAFLSFLLLDLLYRSAERPDPNGNAYGSFGI